MNAQDHNEDYDERFKDIEKKFFRDYKISPETTRLYPKRFNGMAILALTLFGESITDPKKTEIYPEWCEEQDIVYYAVSDIPPEVVREYGYGFTSLDVDNFIKIKVSPAEANQYPENVKRGSYNLYEKNITPQIAKEYSSCFSSGDIIHLIKNGISPQKANELIKEMNILEILIWNRFKKEDLNEKQIELINKLINDSPKNFILSPNAAIDLKKDGPPSSYSNSGMQSVIFSLHRTIMKISREAKHEFDLMLKLKTKHKSLDNIVNIKSELIQGIAFELDYIAGNTLEESILKKEMDKDNIIMFGYGVINGLVQMRYAGIFYHRDIRPQNILIGMDSSDFEKKRQNENYKLTHKSIIIDLGVATTDRHALPLCNRRYGSPDGFLANDLISLGQVMYFMATGTHLFDESQSMSTTFSSQAKEIQDSRNQAYQDKTGKTLESYLKKVDENIADEKVRYLTKRLLTAKSYEYKKMWKLFAEYAK